MTAPRLRRNHRIACHSVEEGVWGLFDLDSGKVLFADELDYQLFQISESFETTEEMISVCEENLVAHSPEFPIDISDRVKGLEAFGCFTAEMEPAAGGEVLLVEPPCPHKMIGTKGPAKSLTYLSGALRGHGLPGAKILDMRSVSDKLGDSRSAQAEYFSRHATQCSPAVIGVTAVSATIEQALFIVQLARSIFPHAVIVMGGPHVSYEWEDLLRTYPAIDFIVRGEGEMPFPVLVERLMKRKATEFRIDDVPGIAWRDGEGRPVTTGWCHGYESLDDIPTPDDRAGVLNISEYEIDYPRIIASRGCPFKCSFCSTATFTGRRIRRRSIENILEEIRLYLEKYGARQITFDDDIFTAKKKYTYAFCEALERSGLADEVQWGCNTRIDCIDEPMLDAMYRAGCRWIFFGIESGDENVQQRFGKGGRVLEGFRRKIEHMLKIGIDPHLNFILGLPGENPQTIRKIKDLIRGMPKVPCAFNFLTVFPGTPLSVRAEELGIEFLGDTNDERYSLTAPTIRTPTMSEHQQIEAFLELEWQRKQDLDNWRDQSRRRLAAS